MKKILVVLMSAVFLLSCNTGKDQTKSEVAAAGNHDEHTQETGRLELNNGSKWKVDSATFLNVESLKSIVAGAENESMSYIQKAKALETGLDKMIAECKMKGADHEALHHWLEPLLGKTKALKQIPSAAGAASILNEIEKQVNLFYQFFELS